MAIIVVKFLFFFIIIGKRKKAEKTIEDEELAKKIKLGGDGDKLRNPRQEKDFNIMMDCKF